MKLSDPLWNFEASTSAAWTDCSDGASKPPWESRDATLPPRTAAITTNRPVTARMATRWAMHPSSQAAQAPLGEGGRAIDVAQRLGTPAVPPVPTHGM